MKGWKVGIDLLEVFLSHIDNNVNVFHSIEWRLKNKPNSYQMFTSDLLKSKYQLNCFWVSNFNFSIRLCLCKTLSTVWSWLTWSYLACQDRLWTVHAWKIRPRDAHFHSFALSRIRVPVRRHRTGTNMGAMLAIESRSRRKWKRVVG